jgi:hypothetical protein
MSPSYVSDHNIEMPLNEVPVEHDNITDIYDYMRLCGAQHNLIYVKMLFMLSSFKKHLFGRSYPT